MITNIISSALHLVFCYLLTVRWNMGVEGLGIATLCSYFTMVVIMVTYANCIPSIKPALFWPTRASFTGWKEYLRLSIPAAVMQCAEVWAIEVMIFVAGLLGVVE